MTRQIGKVKFFCDTRGFGFISPDGGARDIFVHRSGLAESCRGELGLTLTPDQVVSFETVDTPKGAKAISVELEQ